MSTDRASTDFLPGTPSWIDLGTTDVPSAKDFYGALFGWTVEDLGPEAGGYGFIRVDGKQVGGIGPAMDPARGSAWSVYFATADADETAAKVSANGGRVIMAPMDVMGQGRMAVFADPAGAFFSVWQPGQHKGAEVVHSPGSLEWVELYSSDVPAAKTFYEAVLPISTRDVDLGEGASYTLLQVGTNAVAGAMQVGPEAGPPHWSTYFNVEDCDATADRATQLGATETIRRDSPAGRFAVLTDPQGATFSIIRPNPDLAL